MLPEPIYDPKTRKLTPESAEALVRSGQGVLIHGREPLYDEDGEHQVDDQGRKQYIITPNVITHPSQLPSRASQIDPLADPEKAQQERDRIAAQIAELQAQQELLVVPSDDELAAADKAFHGEGDPSALDYNAQLQWLKQMEVPVTNRTKPAVAAQVADVYRQKQADARADEDARAAADPNAQSAPANHDAPHQE